MSNTPPKAEQRVIEISNTNAYDGTRHFDDATGSDPFKFSVSEPGRWITVSNLGDGNGPPYVQVACDKNNIRQMNSNLPMNELITKIMHQKLADAFKPQGQDAIVLTSYDNLPGNDYGVSHGNADFKDYHYPVAAVNDPFDSEHGFCNDSNIRAFLQNGEKVKPQWQK